ncbi:MAG TPA: stage V sporulation protein T [Firmicutes bacterium]|nr:stage V sporulation protein T [Bacillota bacterium]
MTTRPRATGIVRRIDDLGRVVIPKEIRRTLRIREGDPLEIFVDRDGEVILKKYSPIGELGDFAQEYSDSLFESTGHVAIITDRDAVVAVSGASKKQWVDKDVVAVVEESMESRRSMTLKAGEYPEDEQWDFAMQVIAPIISEGDPIGSVILGTNEPNLTLGELELKLCETAAGFLAKQMEQ